MIIEWAPMWECIRGGVRKWMDAPAREQRLGSWAVRIEMSPLVAHMGSIKEK